MYQAAYITYAIDSHEVAKGFVKHNDINPIQVFRDLDETFMEQNPLTKDSFISNIWSIRPKPDEKLFSFFARLVSDRLTLPNMFRY